MPPENDEIPLPKAEDIPLDIIYEDENILIINKQAGVIVHPGDGNPNGTIVNGLLYKYENSLNFCKIFDNPYRPGIVHRLDKTTSGVLLVAKTNKTHAFLQKNWDKVEKTYLAVVENRGNKLPKSGKITAGITRDPRNRQRMTVSNEESAKLALTFFEKIAENKKFTLLKINIPTGRTHQIRVHLSSIGFPIHGDEKYGGKPAERVLLHAEKIVFPNPDQNGEMTEIIAPAPAEFSLE